MEKIKVGAPEKLYDGGATKITRQVPKKAIGDIDVFIKKQRRKYVKKSN